MSDIGTIFDNLHRAHAEMEQLKADKRALFARVARLTQERDAAIMACDQCGRVAGEVVGNLRKMDAYLLSSQRQMVDNIADYLADCTHEALSALCRARGEE